MSAEVTSALIAIGILAAVMTLVLAFFAGLTLLTKWSDRVMDRR